SRRPPTPAFSTLSLHDALPILPTKVVATFSHVKLSTKIVNSLKVFGAGEHIVRLVVDHTCLQSYWHFGQTTNRIRQVVIIAVLLDRKSTRLNSSHVSISYAVFC